MRTRAQNGHSDFLIAIGQPNLGLANWNAPNRPLRTSTYRRQPAGRGYVSISAGGTSGDRVEWPVNKFT